MKKVFAITCLMVLLVSVAAFAVEPPVQPNWSFKLTADNGAGGGAMAAGQIGVDALAVDGADVKDTLPSFVVGSGTRGFGMVNAAGTILYKNEYKSNSSPLASTNPVLGVKSWDIRVFATPGTVAGANIRLFFGTTSLALAPKATVFNQAGEAQAAWYTLKMVNNRGVEGAPAEGTTWIVPIPTAVSTNYFSITLPMLQLSAGNAGAAIAEGYVLEFAQNTQAVPEPGTVAAALALLAPAGMMFRRRRA